MLSLSESGGEVMYQSKVILITGGTGSWGQELTRNLLIHNPKEIRVFSRNEFSQAQMQQAFNNNSCLKFIIGDVRDFQAVEEATKNVDYVFHLAALKHVPICEAQPSETLKTNVLGTENIIRASIINRVQKVIDVSTDKAAEPINFYGMTKSFGEKLMIQANSLSETTSFVCIRGGNVLGTNGSAVPIFKNQILLGKEVTLTSKEMTRFFLTLSEAINLLLKASEVAIGGEIFVMKMNACRISDLIDVLGKNLSSNPVKVKDVGIRPGEKLHEVLVSQYESPHTLKFNDQYYVILPTHPSYKLYSKYQHLEKVPFIKYQSNDYLMNQENIERMLKKGGFI